MRTNLHKPAAPSRRPAASDGFTLIELMISLAVFSILIVGTLALFDSSNRLAAGQIARSEMQQSARIAQQDLTRRVRLIGRGGLQLSSAVYAPPDGAALEVIQNVPGGTNVIPADTSSPDVFEATDVLVARGAFDVPVYLADFRDDTSFTLNVATDTGTVVLNDVTPLNAFGQDLDQLADVLQDPDNSCAVRTEPIAILMVAAFSSDIWGVVEADPANSTVTRVSGCGTAVTRIELAFQYYDNDGSDSAAVVPDPATPGSAREAFSALSSEGYFPEIRLLQPRVRSVAVLQEYRYYIRDEDPGSTEDPPKLSRAEVAPNWNVVAAGGSLQDDIADHVYDLQVAYGCDPDAVGVDQDGLYPETADGANDAWEGNNVADDGACDTDPRHLRVVRVSTLVRAPRANLSDYGPEIDRIEDHDYPAGTGLNAIEQRRYERVVIRTLADLRNL